MLRGFFQSFATGLHNYRHGRRGLPRGEVLSAEQIRLCYEVVLGRGAEEEGLQQFLRLAREQRINDPHAIAKMFYRSEEFRNRFGSGEAVDIYGETMDVALHGLSMHLPRNDDIARAIVATGTYEPYLLDHLLAHVREGDVFVDIGANLGAIALPVAKQIGSKGRVIAFEPSQRNIVLLIKNALLNELTNVEAYPIGLADRNGAVLSYIDLHSSNKALQDEPLSSLRRGMEIVPIVKLDAFLDDRIKVDVMKMDVEGFEYKVLQGSLETIRRARPHLYLEYSDSLQRSASGVPGRRLLQLLIDLGYEPTVLHRNRSPEAMGRPRAADAIDELWRTTVAAGGTHLDLYWKPEG